MEKIRFLLISDLHYSNIHKTDIKPIINAIIDDIKIYEKNDIILDFLIFSGDIVFSGKKEEFDGIKILLFDRIIKETSIQSNNIFIVPGNHDINLNEKSEMYFKGLKSALNDEPTFQQILLKEFDNEQLVSGLKNYYEFETLTLLENDTKHKKIFKSHIINKNKLKIGISCLNSSWNANGGRSDYGELIIGHKQINDALDEIADCHFKICIMHHPWRWLNIIDQKIIKPKLLQNYHIVISGHDHTEDSIKFDSSYGYTVFIENNCLFESYDKLKGYTYIELDLSENKGKAIFKILDREQKFVNANIFTNGIEEFVIFDDKKFNLNSLQIDSNNKNKAVIEFFQILNTNTKTPIKENHVVSHEYSIIDKENFLQFVNNIYNRIIPFSNFITFTPEHLMNIIDPTNRFCYLRYNQIMIHNKEICKYISEALINHEFRKEIVILLKNELKTIRDFLAKSGIVSIITTEYGFNWDISYRIPEVNHPIDNAILNFDFIMAEKLTNDLSISMDQNNVFRLIEYSRFLFETGQPTKAFDIAKTSMEKAKSDRNYTAFVIAEYNLKRIFGHIWANSFSLFEINTDFVFSQREEIFNLDIDNEFDQFFEGKFEYEQRKYFLTMRDIYSNKVMYDYIVKMQRIVKQIHEDYKTFENKSSTWRNPRLSDIADFDRYYIEAFIESNNVIYNYTSDNIEFFKLYCEAMFVRHKIDRFILNSTFEKQDKKHLMELETINYNVLRNSIRYFYKTELQDLIDSIKLNEIYISAETRAELINAFKNILEYINQIAWKTKRLLFVEYFIQNFILIFKLTKTEFTEKEIDLFREKLQTGNVDKKYWSKIKSLQIGYPN